MHEQWWVKELGLQKTEHEQLIKKEQLTEKHIHAADELLRSEFSEVTGNQSSLLSQTNGFDCLGEGSIQIHHDRQLGHWVTSTMRGEVVLYDSSVPTGCLKT